MQLRNSQSCHRSAGRISPKWCPLHLPGAAGGGRYVKLAGRVKAAALLTLINFDTIPTDYVGAASGGRQGVQ